MVVTVSRCLKVQKDSRGVMPGILLTWFNPVMAPGDILAQTEPGVAPED